MKVFVIMLMGLILMGCSKNEDVLSKIFVDVRANCKGTLTFSIKHTSLTGTTVEEICTETVEQRSK